MQTPTVFVQPLRAITRINICVHVKNPKLLAAIPLWGQTKIQTHSVNPQRRNVDARGHRGIENSHVHYSSPVKQVCYL